MHVALRKTFRFSYRQTDLSCSAARGYQVFLAGGCVRDHLLGSYQEISIWQLTLRPDEVEALFPKTIGVGKSFGVVIVVQDGIEVEVTSFRGDGLLCRWPQA